MNLIAFSNYQDYADSFITHKDVRYLGNKEAERQLIKYASGKNFMPGLLTLEQFNERREKEILELKPRGVARFELFGDYLTSDDKVLKQFALREKQLFEKKISTVVYLLMRSKKGMEISSFIDLEQSLRESRCHDSQRYVNWRSVFEGRAKLMPAKHHLSYFNWHQNRMLYNDSDNFRVFKQGAHSMLLKHKGDHKVICVNATCECSYARNAKHEMFTSPIYGCVIFFDHIIRRIN